MKKEEPYDMAIYRWKLPYLAKALGREVRTEDPKPTSPFAHAWITLKEYDKIQSWLKEHNKTS